DCSQAGFTFYTAKLTNTWVLRNLIFQAKLEAVFFCTRQNCANEAEQNTLLGLSDRSAFYLLRAAHYCFTVLIVTQFLSIMYFTKSDSPFSFIISIPNLRFVRVINCPNRIMNGLNNLQSLTDTYLSQSAQVLNPFSVQHGLT
ncbi:MAG: hypothetical protein KJ754_07850, partial [Bacteroidetes bacterium]|nr:hypothetical protein [Bacteroidota bacterium]